MSRRWKLNFDANTLDAAPERPYVGTSPRMPYYGDTGRTYVLGITFNY